MKTLMMIQIALVLLLAACSGASEPEVIVENTVVKTQPPADTPTPEPTDTPTPVPTLTPQPTSTPTPELTATPTPEPTNTPVPSPTPSPAVDPDLIMELLMQADSSYHAGDCEEAVSTSDEMVELVPSEPNFYVLRSDALEKMGDFDGAIADLLTAIDLGATDPGIANNVCWFYGLTERPELALPYCEQAVEAQPISMYRDSRGLVYALLGDFDASVDDFQFVVDDLEGALDPELQQIRVERLEWLELLKAGENPFTQEVLAVLRGEMDEEADQTTEVEQPSTETAQRENIKGVPIMPGAQNGEETSQGGYAFRIDATHAEVKEYYDQQLVALGWQMLQSDLSDDGCFVAYMNNGEVVAVASISIGVDTWVFIVSQ